jgi:hypothetical protein
MMGAVWRIRDVYPGSRILNFAHPGSRISDPGSRIPDLGSRIQDQKATKERDEKKFCQTFFFIATYFTKFSIVLFLNAEEKNLGQFSKNYEAFYPKNCHLALKNMALGFGIRDPGSGKKPIPDPGSRGKKGTGSPIRIRNTRWGYRTILSLQERKTPAARVCSTN